MSSRQSVDARSRIVRDTGRPRGVTFAAVVCLAAAAWLGTQFLGELGRLVSGSGFAETLPVWGLLTALFAAVAAGILARRRWARWLGTAAGGVAVLYGLFIAGFVTLMAISVRIPFDDPLFLGPMWFAALVMAMGALLVAILLRSGAWFRGADATYPEVGTDATRSDLR